jgi:hypothetical protein
MAAIEAPVATAIAHPHRRSCPSMADLPRSKDRWFTAGSSPRAQPRSCVAGSMAIRTDAAFAPRTAAQREGSMTAPSRLRVCVARRRQDVGLKRPQLGLADRTGWAHSVIGSARNSRSPMSRPRSRVGCTTPPRSSTSVPCCQSAVTRPRPPRGLRPEQTDNPQVKSLPAIWPREWTERGVSRRLLAKSSDVTRLILRRLVCGS